MAPVLHLLVKLLYYQSCWFKLRCEFFLCLSQTVIISFYKQNKPKRKCAKQVCENTKMKQLPFHNRPKSITLANSFSYSLSAFIVSSGSFICCFFSAITDGESKSRGPSGLAEAGGCCCRNVAEERHEPGDGGAGERTLEQPQYPWSFALCKTHNTPSMKIADYPVSPRIINHQV